MLSGRKGKAEVIELEVLVDSVSMVFVTNGSEMNEERNPGRIQELDCDVGR